MQIVAIIIALAAPLAASRKHDGKEHLHPAQRRQEQGSGVLAPSAPAIAVATTPSVTPTISSYIFPTTVIQEPVATVCPDTPSSSAIFSILPVSSLASMEGSNATGGLTNDTTSYIPVQVNATALLPNGSTTVFLSTTSTTASLPPFSDSPTIPSNTSDDSAGDGTARIILDSKGCQTVYSAKTTSVCATIIKPAGMIPVPVTDCDQWITFSSQKLDGCSTDAAPSSPSAAAADGPMAYYLAHWYDLAQGAIPDHVRVQDCLPGSMTSDCVTSSESWEVVTSTTTTTGTSVASFRGPAVISAGAHTLTTSLSFETTHTTTAVITTSSIARHRLAGDTSSEQTVTVMVTMPTTMTLSLDSFAKATVTVRQTSTLQVMETRTRGVDDVSPSAASEEP
ncbi:hypothetical protein PV04_01366 [Phialophora macrospora]|uniref:Ig-like domain-containing protein n=1 Tax=Phialophora macrospora TaxID=1851006 RepID=A0A0D2EFV0_9EURO|nr:hypothetical protein PV04_01366 [Phialophora macrospora]